MRKFVMTAATALTLGAMTFATPAFADHNDYNNGGNYNQNKQYQNNQYPNGQYPNGQYNGSQGYQGDGQWRRGDRNLTLRFDFNRHEGNFDRWERGWRSSYHRYGQHHQLSYRQLIRRIERQGYVGVRGLRPSDRGYGWRAFAFYASDGHPVMLRIDPYSGRVLAARHL